MYLGVRVIKRYSCQILTKLEFSRQIFEKNIKIQNFMKIRQVVAELFHADGQTYMTKLAVAFRNFANAPKNNVRDRNTVFFDR